MKTLVFANDFRTDSPDAGSRRLYDLALAKANERHEVHVLLPRQQEEFEQEKSALREESRENKIPENIHLHFLKGPLPVRHYDDIGNTVIANICMVERAMQLIDQVGKFDQIITSGWTFSHVAKSIQAITGAKWIHSSYQSTQSAANRTPDQIYIAEMEAWARQNCDGKTAEPQQPIK